MSDVRKINFDESDETQLPNATFGENLFHYQKTLSQKLAEGYMQAEEQARELTGTINVLRKDLSGERRQMEALLIKYNELVGEKTAQEEHLRSLSARMLEAEEQMVHILGHNHDLEEQRIEMNKRFQKMLSQFQLLHAKWNEAEGHLKAAGVSTGLGQLQKWLDQVRSYIVNQEKNKKEMHESIMQKENELKSHAVAGIQLKDQCVALQSHSEKITKEKELLEQKLRAMVEQLEGQHKNVRQTSQALQSELARFKADNLRLTTELQERIAQSQIVAKSEQVLRRENSEIQAANTQLRQANELLNTEIMKSKQSVQALENKAQGAAQKALSDSQKINALEEQLVLIKSQYLQAQEALNSSERNKSSEMSDLQRRISEMVQTISELEDEALSLRSEHTELQTHVQHVERNARVAEINSEQYAVQLQEAYKEIKNLKAEIENIDRKLTFTSQQVQERDRQILESKSQHEAMLKKFGVLEESYKENIRSLEKANVKQEEHYQEEVRKLENSIARFEMTIDTNQSEKNMLEAKITGLEAEVSSFQQESLDKKNDLYAERKELGVRALQLEMREKQLTVYSESLNKMKLGLREQMTRFEYELQMARSVNPISDYLKITEREIRRVDLQLKKTPTVSRERLRLEECLEELFEQRDFLLAHSKRTQNDLDNRRQRLQKLMGGDALQSSPPLPPRRNGGV